MKLLAVVLSPMGLEKVNEIREADDDFKANGLKRGPGERGGPPPGSPPPAGRISPPPGFGEPGAAGSHPGGPPPFSSDDMFGSNLYDISFLVTAEAERATELPITASFSDDAGFPARSSRSPFIRL